MNLRQRINPEISVRLFDVSEEEIQFLASTKVHHRSDIDKRNSKVFLFRKHKSCQTEL